MNDFSIQTVHDPRGVVIRISGPIDIHNHDALTRQLSLALADRSRVTVLDLAGATLISSICIGALVMFRRAIMANGGTVFIAAPQALVADELKRVAIQQLFPIVPSAEAALAGTA